MLKPRNLVGHARRAGLDGVALAEHLGMWFPDELAQLRGQRLTVLAAREVNHSDQQLARASLWLGRPAAPGL